jgi:hypothetical protein
MPKIEQPSYSVDIEWDSTGKPVLYIIGRGRVTTAKDALDVIGMAVKMTDEGPHDHVCAVYNMLEVTQIPFLGRFISTGRFPSSRRTAHIILGTHSQALRLVGSLAAVTNSKRLRTYDVCTTQEEVDKAVQRWLALPDRARAYTINDI